jgi:hypothetical protein
MDHREETTIIYHRHIITITITVVALIGIQPAMDGHIMREVEGARRRRIVELPGVGVIK